MAMTNAQRAYLDTRNMLGEERNKAKVVKRLVGRGLKADQATQLVDQVYHDNLRENRKTAVAKIVLSFLMLLGFGIALLFGLLFYIALPVAAFGFLWGILNWVTASGWEIATTVQSDD